MFKYCILLMMSYLMLELKIIRTYLKQKNYFKSL